MIVYDQLFDSDGAVLDSVVISTALSVTSTIEASTFTTAGTYVFPDGVSTVYGFPVTFTGKCLLVVSGSTQPLAATQVLFANSKVWYRSSVTDEWKDERNFTSTEVDEVTALKNKLLALMGILIPLGTICMFSGTFGGDDNRYPIPLGTTEPNTNWCICDGVTTNGLTVPDLRNRFIIGSGSTYKTGNIGGAASQTVSISGSVGGTTLTTSQMPSHVHQQSTHGVPRSGDAISQRYWKDTGTSNYNFTTYATGGSDTHTHTLSLTQTSVDTIPPYYALAFIIMIKASA